MDYEKLLEAVHVIKSSIESCPDPNAKDWIFGQCRQTIDWLENELKHNLTSRSSRAAGTEPIPDCRHIFKNPNCDECKGV